jgi:hypothetical protein
MIWIGFVVMILTIVVSAASLRSSRGDALGIPLVALGTFTFLYVIQPLELARDGTMRLFLTDWQVTKALLVSALMLACFMVGWLYPGRLRYRQSFSWDPGAMWKVGFAAAWIGLILWMIFLERSGGIAHSFSEAHGHAMAWTDNTAYLYNGPWLMLSGAVMMIFADPRISRYNWRTVAPYAFLGLFLANGALGGDRGPTFAALSTAFISYTIARRKQVRLNHAAVYLLITGCAVAMVFANRSRIHFGPRDPGQTQSSTEVLGEFVGTSVYDQEHDSTGQEFLLHAATIDTVDHVGKLDWGLGWVEFLFINPIPKLLWPEKHYPAWTGITANDISEQTGISRSGGSAAAIVADLYIRFQLFSVFFFWGLGSALRRLLVRALNFTSPVTTVGYVMIYAISLNMFAQGFGTIIVPVCYSMTPVVLFAWATRRKRQKALLLQREITLRQFAAARSEPWSS